jgi:putative transcriptional regulator
MQISHHADDATLMSYAAGSLPEALSVVVAAHVSMCPLCAHEVRRLEAIGSAMLAGLRPVAMIQDVPPQAEMRTPRPPASDRRTTNTDLPRPLDRLIGTDLADIPWKRLGFGVWHLPLDLSEEAEGDLRLLRVAPGRIMPEHGHGGSELTLILNGAYIDKYGQFCAGDIADLDDSVEHRPISHDTQGCICIVASEKKAKFKGLIGRIAQPLTGL